MALSLDELAELLGGEVLRRAGGGSYDGVASLEDAGPGEVGFLGNDAYRGQFATTAAGAVVVARGESGGPEGCALVGVDNPTLAFQLVVEHFRESGQRAFEPGIDERAVLAADAEVDPEQVAVGPGVVIGAASGVGKGTTIGANVVIGDGVRIGSDCLIHPNVTITDGCRLGDRVTLHAGVVIGSDGFGYEQVDGRNVKISQVGTVELGDDVEVGANSTIDRARFGCTVIGEGTKIDNLVQVGHNAVIGRHCRIVAQTGIAGSSVIGDRVLIAAQGGVGGHVRVGDDAVLTARAAAMVDLEGGQTYSELPARPFQEQQKIRAHVQRLPKLVERVRKLEAGGKTEDRG